MYINFIKYFVIYMSYVWYIHTYKMRLYKTGSFKARQTVVDGIGSTVLT